MTGQSIDHGNGKTMTGAAVAALVVASVFCEARGAAAPCCLLLEKMAWATFEALRSVILLVIWQAASAYLYQDQGLVHRAAQIGAGLLRLLGAVLGQG